MFDRLNANTLRGCNGNAHQISMIYECRYNIKSVRQLLNTLTLDLLLSYLYSKVKYLTPPIDCCAPFSIRFFGLCVCVFADYFQIGRTRHCQINFPTMSFHFYFEFNHLLSVLLFTPFRIKVIVLFLYHLFLYTITLRLLLAVVAVDDDDDFFLSN